MEDLKKAINYKRNGEHLAIYKKKIEEMADKILSHKWEKEELMKELIMNSCKDSKIKKKIKSKKIEKTEEIFKVT